ncbi:MAG: aminotransferase class III-fold pyridoxal phosphate-dependent enzyme, partial [Ginsengibacter sp.]
EVCAVIVEGIQGVGGIRVASKQFLQLIRSLCNEYGAVYIADSVQCGYGRTGKFYSHDYAQVDADIYTMAKGMGNGFPIGAISISPAIAPKHFMLGTTFGCNHLACAAAIAVLEVMEEEKLMENAKEVGSYLMNEIEKVSGLKNVRGKGLMIGFDVSGELNDLRKNLLQKHKIFTGYAKPNVIRILPSLALTMEDADKFLNALKEEVASLVLHSKNVAAEVND